MPVPGADLQQLVIQRLLTATGREYIDEIKRRLRNDDAWALMVCPELEERTRWALSRIIESIDDQVRRASERSDTPPTEDWLRRVNTLRRYVGNRLSEMEPVEVAARSNTKEAQAWRAFSARLARRLEEAAPGALETIWTPYGGMTAAQWLAVREERGL